MKKRRGRGSVAAVGAAATAAARPGQRKLQTNMQAFSKQVAVSGASTTVSAAPADSTAVAVVKRAAISTDSASVSTSSAAFFLQKAKACESAFPPDFSLALKYLLKGVSLHPTNVDLLVRAAESLAEEGDFKKAKEFLLRAISLEPEGSATKFFCLAQLEEGNESLQLLRRGIEILQKEQQRQQHQQEEAHQPRKQAATARKRQLVEAYCSIAELYMTDLCDKEDAEAEVQKAIQAAEELAPQWPEVLHVKASFFKVIGRIDEARAAAKKAADIICMQLKQQEKRARIFPPSSPTAYATACDASVAADGTDAATVSAKRGKAFVMNGTNDTQAEQTEENEEDEDLFVSSSETRVNLSRVLVDVGEGDLAVFLCSSCLQEDDQDADAWLVLACALYKTGSFEAAKEALTQLEQVLARRTDLPASHPMRKHSRQLMKRLQEEERSDKK